MQEFYKNASVFVTGATGFLGKSVVEKLLRAVPDVDKVYILIRAKRGQSVHARLQQLLQSPVFDVVRQENAGVLDKIVPIVGDISSPDLGISADDRVLLERHVSVVIHSAATIKINENLKIAVNVNVGGMHRVVQLCKGMGNLKVLIYVSTAYSNSDLKDAPVQENVYPISRDTIALLQKMDTMDAEYFAESGKPFIGKKPNTYTFTKAVAEYLLQEEVTQAGIPACIVRPSMITGAWNEPVPGWIEGFSGPVGLSLAVATGLLKVLFGDSNIAVDTVPIDMVVNTILVAAWETGRRRKPVTVYNCCSGASNPITFGRYVTLLEHHIQNSSPLCRAVWYPHVTTTLNRSWYETQCFLFHYLPACLMDLPGLLLSLPKNLPRWFRVVETEMSQKVTPKVVTLHKKIMSAADTVEYFRVNGWSFETKNMERLHQALKELSVSEQRQWSFDFAEYSWEEYMARLCYGMKIFLAKEPGTSLTVAKKHTKRLRLIKRTCDAFGTLILLILVGIFLWQFITIMESCH